MASSFFRSSFSMQPTRHAWPAQKAVARAAGSQARTDRPVTMPPPNRQLRKQVAAANPAARAGEIAETDDFAELPHAINHMLDFTDAFVRDTVASLEYVSQGKYFRRIIRHGTPEAGAEAPPGGAEAAVDRPATRPALAARDAGVGTQEAAKSDTALDNLSGAANSIHLATALIQGVAGQINPVALNATIEAARAGEAGGGFALAAAEVQALANHTAKATDDLSGRGTTGPATVGAPIDDLNKIAVLIEVATQRRSAATMEISRSIQLATDSAADIAGQMLGIADVAAETGRAAKEVLDASRELSSQAGVLRANVAMLLSALRDAG